MFKFIVNCTATEGKKQELPKYKGIVIFVIAILIFSFFTVIRLNEGNSKAPLEAQVVWQKTYGGFEDDRAFYAIASSRGYLVIGSAKSGSENATLGWAIQIDQEGNVIWNKTYVQGLGTELRYGLKLTDGYLLVGNQYLEGNDINGFVIKINDEGTILWNRTIGGNNTNKLFSAIQSTDGFVLIGLTYPSKSNNSIAWIVKIDLNGNILWNNEYLTGTNSAIRQGILAPDGNYIIAGYTETDVYRFLAIKIDQTGNLMWNSTYGQENSQKAYSITNANDGCIIVGDKVSPQSDSDAWVIKLDWNGTMMWDRTLGGKYADSAAVISNSEDGKYLISGFTFSYGNGNRDICLYKISSNGDVLWSCTNGDPGYQEAYKILDAGKNQYLVVGWTDPPKEPSLIGKAQYDFYVAKLSPQLSLDLTIRLLPFAF
jgi:hypothetical protein